MQLNSTDIPFRVQHFLKTETKKKKSKKKKKKNNKKTTTKKQAEQYWQNSPLEMYQFL